MQEIIADYTGNETYNWIHRKTQAVVNRYYHHKRDILWQLHICLHPIKLELSKIPPHSMPILINNYNRLEPLKQQIQWLLSLPEEISILIVDNKSDYPPLLDFYTQLDHPHIQIVKLGFNSWRKGIAEIARMLKNFNKFIITDPDLLPYDSTPKDLISHLSELMDRYPAYNHIGVSLEINDLPDNDLREKVFRHESKHWPPHACKLDKDVFRAPVDTTFAMYRNNSKVDAIAPALRTNRPYTLRHIDWYVQQGKLSEEHQYYLSSVTPVATWAVEIKKKKPIFHLY